MAGGGRERPGAPVGISETRKKKRRNPPFFLFFFSPSPVLRLSAVLLSPLDAKYPCEPPLCACLSAVSSRAPLLRRTSLLALAVAPASVVVVGIRMGPFGRGGEDESHVGIADVVLSAGGRVTKPGGKGRRERAAGVL